jgi:mono/diheme cytochrome c family protein
MLRVLGIALFTVLLFASLGSAQDKVQQGSALFTAQKCVMCHSIAGKGNKKGSLDSVGAKLKPAEIREWLTSPERMREKHNETRTPAMKDPKLSKDQIDALVAFLQSQKAAASADDAR